MSLGSYMGLVDLNTNASVVKYTAELVATGRRDELAPMVNAGVQILATLSFGLLALSLLLLPWLTPLIFKTAAYPARDLMLLSALCMLSFAVLFTGNVYMQVLQGLLRQDEVNAIGALGVAVNAGAVALVVVLGLGVAWIGVANLFANCTVALVIRWRAHSLAPELPWFSIRSTPAWRRSLLHFTAGSYAFTLWGFFYNLVPKMLLANRLGPVLVGFYDVGTKLAAQSRNIVWTLSQYLIPFITDTAAREGNAKLPALQVRALTFIWMVGFGISGYLLAVRAPLLQLWLRPDPLLAPLLFAAVFWVLVEFTLGSFAMPWVHFALAEERLRHTRPFLLYIIPACILGPWLGMLAGAQMAGAGPSVGVPGAPEAAAVALSAGAFKGFLVGGALANSLGTLLFYVIAVRERGLDAGALAWRLGRVTAGAAAGLAALGLVEWAPRPLSLALAGLLWCATLGAAWVGLGLWDEELAARLRGKLGFRGAA